MGLAAHGTPRLERAWRRQRRRRRRQELGRADTERRGCCGRRAEASAGPAPGMGMRPEGRSLAAGMIAVSGPVAAPCADVRGWAAVGVVGGAPGGAAQCGLMRSMGARAWFQERICTHARNMRNTHIYVHTHMCAIIYTYTRTHHNINTPTLPS